jgi:hypothetical protein
VELGGEHDVLAPGVVLDRAADELLRGTGLVDVRGVPERDPELDGLSKEGLCLGVVERPLVRGVVGSP